MAPVGGGMSWTVKYNKLPAYAEGIGRRARAASVEFVQHVIEKLQNRMRSGPHSGRIYKWRGRYHRASAPGEAPAIRSGETIRSLSFSSVGRGGSIQIKAGGAARFLQRGTSRMAPRRFIEEELREQRNDFFKRIAAAVRFRED